ncbi:hypothetical protein GGI35DRAFT_489783 [Trichoderma velutinum]
MANHASEEAFVLLDSGHMALYKIAEDEDRVILPVMFATVRLNGGSGSFLYAAEAELSPFSQNNLELSYGYQPCWLWPRKDWPAEEPPLEIEIGNIEHAAEVFRHIQSNDANLTPPDLYYHLWSVHVFLNDSLSRRQTNGLSLIAMLRIILRGIRHVACALDECFTIEIDSMHRPIQEKRNNGFGLAYRCKFPDATRFHSKVKGYRLVAGFMDFQDFHFTAFVWDRVDKTFFYFDSLQEGRDERARSAIASWANFLIDIGLPLDFNYIVVPATGQSGDWQSGYTCLMFLQHTLRGLVGLDSMTLASFIRNHLIKTSRLRFPRQDVGKIPEFQLRFRDWCMTGKVDRGILAKPLGNTTRLEQGIRFAIETTQYMALNELGILQEVCNNEGIGVELGHGASMLHQTSGRCRADATLTPIGGKSFVTYKGLGISSGCYLHYRAVKKAGKETVLTWKRTDKLPREARKVKLPPRFRPQPRVLPQQRPPSYYIRVKPDSEKPSSAKSESSICVGVDVAEEISLPSLAADFATRGSGDASLGDASLGDVGCQGTAELQTKASVERHMEAEPTYRDDLYTSSFFMPMSST